MIQLSKSNLEPATEITHLGFKINSVSQIISLPDEKIERILIFCNELLTAKRITTINNFLQLCAEQPVCGAENRQYEMGISSRGTWK